MPSVSLLHNHRQCREKIRRRQEATPARFSEKGCWRYPPEQRPVGNEIPRILAKERCAGSRFRNLRDRLAGTRPCCSLVAWRLCGRQARQRRKAELSSKAFSFETGLATASPVYADWTESRRLADRCDRPFGDKRAR